MKITQKRIKEIIQEEIQNINEAKKVRSLTDDVKTFKKEYAVKSGKLREKATKLQERQKIMEAVGMINDSIMKMIGELNELPVTEVLENVKKSHANKYIRAIETLKGICEHNTGWIKENK
jgi:restriction endonuclease Mrr